jgi:hypothetical protein
MEERARCACGDDQPRDPGFEPDVQLAIRRGLAEAHAVFPKELEEIPAARD